MAEEIKDGKILIGGLNASKKNIEDKPKSKKPRKSNKNKIKQESVEVTAPVDGDNVVIEDKVNIEDELKKMDNLPDSIQTDAKVDGDKVQIDLSSVFGPGTFAEIEGEEAKQFLKEQAAGKDPAKTIVNDIKENQNDVSNKILEEHETSKEDSSTSEDDISPEIMAAGNPNCYAYLSLKATGIYKPDIISFGLVTEEGKVFYAEMKDVDIMKITPDVLVNVIQRRFNLKQDDITPGRVCVVGDDKYIRHRLLDWIREEYTDKGYVMQIVSDRVSNEFALFLEFLLNGIPLNQYANIISPVCIDLNTILASNLNIERPENMTKEDFLKGYIPTYIALDVDRLAITEDDTPSEYLGNALVNAQAIRAAFRRLYCLDKDEEHVDLIKKKE